MRWITMFGTFAAVAVLSPVAPALAGVRFTSGGVTVWVDDGPYSDDTGYSGGVTAWLGEALYEEDSEYFHPSKWSELSSDALPATLAGPPVLETKSTIVAFSADGSKLMFLTRHSSRILSRGDVMLDNGNGSAEFRLTIDETRKGVAVEVLSATGRRRHVLAMSGDGILEIRPTAETRVQVASPMRHVLTPSLIGTDMLYSAEDLPSDRSAYLPSLNMAVGLLTGGDGMLVAVWPPGTQTVSLARSMDIKRPTSASLSLDPAGISLYLAYLEQPGIWHEETLKNEYLETNTAIDWQRPFEARWIGRFFIESEGYAFPFYFLQESRRLWGRYIRGWFAYPVWFDGERTMVHFEKKFPPQGRLLIYHLDTYDADRLSPFAVMRRSLGREEADRLIDFAGAKEKELLAHRNAVCAMTRQIEGYFADAQDAELRLRVQQFSDDVSTFIRLIRDRVFGYDQFAAETTKFLEAQTQANPDLAQAAEPIRDLLDEIRLIAKEDLPESSLEEVKTWTDQIKRLAGEPREGDLAKVKAITQQCRSVAGTQDDMARDLSILTIQLMEAAGRLGMESPAHVRLAEQLIARSRAVLREPTWWEPCRRYEPKGDPGAP